MTTAQVNQGTLLVTVLEAKDLAPSDPNGQADPYVVLQLQDTKYQTDVIFNSLNPRFGDQFTFDVKNVSADKLYIGVCHDRRHEDQENNAGNNPGIGNVDISVEEIVSHLSKNDEYKVWLPLRDVDRGSLHIACRFVRKAL